MATMVAITAATLSLGQAAAQDRNRLWQIENEVCFPHPDKCVAVERDKGFVVFKDKNGIAQLLLMPSVRITGIESPALLQPGAVNYFAAAWQARKSSPLLAKLSDDRISLVVNSYAARSQDQLHIHIDCLSDDARRQISASDAYIGQDWKRLRSPLRDHPYYAIRIPAGVGLEAADPFKLLARLPAAAEDMGRWTLVVVAAPKGGFLVLADQMNRDTGDWAWGEEVQDHSCAVSTQP